MVDGQRDKPNVCLVHRVTRSEAHRPTPAVGEFRFHLLDSPWKVLTIWRAWTQGGRWRRLPRIAARLIAPYRAMYCVTDKGLLLHEGWLVIGHSPLYDVGPDDVVFGPVSTAAEARGLGLATFGLERAMDVMASRRHRTFYIHTRARNAASRRVIQKCGFGPPIARISIGDPRSSPARPS